jgi:SAM-dependent methyltransferase
MLKATKALFASHEVTFSVKWQQVDVNQPLPFQANLFDVVMAHLMLYHADHMPQAVEHIATIIKPGGYFGVATLCPNSFIEHIKLAHKINNTIPPDGINIFTPEELESSLTKHFTKLYRYDYVNNIRWPTADSALRFSKTLLAISMHNPTEAFYSAYQNQLESIMTQQETFNTHQRVILFMAVK